MDSKKLNVAVFISSGLDSGGGYQYEHMVLNLLKKYHSVKDININFYASSYEILDDYKDLNIGINVIKENNLQKLHSLCLSNIFFYTFFKKIGLGLSFLEKKLLADDIDLVYFLSPNFKSHGLTNIPYIFTLWDLGHLDVMEFPEVSNDRRFELREFNYKKSLKKAIKVIVESDHGKNYAVKSYNLNEKRVEVLRFLPNIRKIESSHPLDIKKKYKLKNNYIFYPAQFWAHKNHVYILKAIKILREKNHIDIDVVFSGSDKGNLNYILEKAKKLKVDDLIHYVGFVSDNEIPSLYKQSIALVMPTYLGPTNIPPLEALYYETPVCYSDTTFFREQMGDSVFYIDLKDPKSLVESLLMIQSDKRITKDKIINGKELLDNWNEHDFYNKLLKIFNDFKNIRSSWG